MDKAAFQHGTDRSMEGPVGVRARLPEKQTPAWV